MADDPLSPKVLVSVANEVEAAAVVSALAAHGIRARAVGGYTSGFRAEAPGLVKVVVGQADLARAEKVLVELESERGEVDWSAVDFGDDPSSQDGEAAPGGADGEPSGEPPPAAPEPDRCPLQFSIAHLLILQTIVSVALAVWRGHQTGLLNAVVLFAATYFALLAVAVVLIVAGTVRVASDLNRAREAWRYVGRALTVGCVVIALFVMAGEALDSLGVTW